MNVFDGHPFKVILDYAHNPAAMEIMCQLADKLDTKGKKMCVLSAPGDRRDEDIQEIARIASKHFDEFICKADDNRRKRGAEEVPKMLQKTLLAEGITSANIKMIPDEVEAVDKALQSARQDDLLIIFGDEITRCWKQIINFNSDGNVAKPGSSAISKDHQTPAEGFVIDKDQRLVRDDRGVYLAKEEAD